MSLVLLAGIGWAADGCSPPITEFRHVVELSSADEAEITDSYRFSMPSGDCPILTVPRAFNGMVERSSSATVVEGRLVADATWKPGQVLVVAATREMQGGPFSAELRAPTFPISRMVVQIRSPLNTPLQVWAEPEATLDVSANKVRQYRASLVGGGRLVWSTYQDWWEVGDQLERRVSQKLASEVELGDLAEGLAYVTVADALHRTAKAVKFEPGRGGFSRARSASEVLAAGRGTAAERALVLLSVLRAAGHKASPAILRPIGSEPGSMSVPADALFDLAGVKVETDEGLAWFDPRSAYVGVGEVPTGFRGGIALSAGDLPVRLHDDMVPDGALFVDASGTISETGALSISASVRAEAGGLQALRELLAPLAKDVRQQWLSDLLTAARPDAVSVRAQVFGVEDPTLPLGVAVEFEEPGAFEELGSEGLIGTVESVLAPQLARVLPPNIQVHERITLKGTDPFVPYGVAPVEETHDPDLLVNRETRIDGTVANIDTKILRPWRASPERLRTEEALYAVTARGPRVVLFGEIDRSVGRELREEAHNNESRVLEALLWYHAGEPEEAEKTLRKAVRMARFRSLLDLLRLYTPRGEMRPWNVVWDAAPDDFARLAVVHALEAKHARREAWRRATELVTSANMAVRIEALVTVARVQGERPAASVDEAANRAWREPRLLLKRAEKLAADAFPGQAVQVVDIPMVQELLRADDCDAATPVLKRALAEEDSPLLRAVHTEWRACVGQMSPAEDLPQIFRDASYSPVVVAAGVRTYERLDRFDEARRWSMLAAHLASNDPELWLTASRAAERAGDLRTASYAAGRGSDLRPEAVTITVPYQIVATLAGDAQAAKKATDRTGYAVSIESIPVSMNNALSFVSEPQRLGLLRLRDADVLSDPALLEERFLMHLSRGDEVGALRDAAWLDREHRAPLGKLFVARATSPSVWSTSQVEGLATAIRNPEIRRLRMELGLVAGWSDPLIDARLLGDLEAAVVVREARSSSKALAARTAWPAGLDNPKVTVPDGFKKARLLSSLNGVVGMQNPDAGVSLLVTPLEDTLPPPMAGVYTLGAEASAEGRIRIHQLEGGQVLFYAASRKVGALTWWGIARSPQLARFAVESGIAAQSVQ